MRISDWSSDVCSSDLNSFWQFVDRAVDVVERTYGRAVIFEHGSVDAESMTSCGTAHAHLHIVPLSFELSAKAIGFDQGLQWEERSEERRVGKECVSTCSSLGMAYN